MNPMAIQLILTGVEALPHLIAAGADALAESKALASQVSLFKAENRDPTPAEWQAQNAKLTQALASLATKS